MIISFRYIFFVLGLCIQVDKSLEGGVQSLLLDRIGAHSEDNFLAIITGVLLAAHPVIILIIVEHNPLQEFARSIHLLIRDLHIYLIILIVYHVQFLRGDDDGLLGCLVVLVLYDAAFHDVC